MNAIVPVTDGFVTQDDAVTVSASSGLQPGAVVMHPLARGPELDEGLDDTAHNLYFAQAAGAVFIREALLLGILGDHEAVASACAPIRRTT
jgi:aspartate carbamoyltransferase catalytic subunit